MMTGDTPMDWKPAHSALGIATAHPQDLEDQRGEQLVKLSLELPQWLTCWLSNTLPWNMVH